MRSLGIVGCVLLLAGVAGCAQLGGAHGRRSHISIAGQGGATVGTLFVWDANVNAGVITEDGEVCMQRAQAITTASTDVSASVSEALLSLAKAAETTARSAGGAGAAEGELAEISAAIDETATLLTTTTERTAFLDVGLFYICQLGVNDAIEPAQAMELTVALIDAAAGLKPTGEDDQP